MATINQQTPNIDFSLQLHPKPASMHDAHPLARLSLETAWSNQMTWKLAHVVNYCFDNNDVQNERNSRAQRWQTLSDQVQQWADERPEAFDPIFQGTAGIGRPFPEIWFTSDWHGMSKNSLVQCGVCNVVYMLIVPRVQLSLSASTTSPVSCFSHISPDQSSQFTMPQVYQS